MVTFDRIDPMFVASSSRIHDLKGVNKFGHNPDLGTAEEDVHDGGGTWVAPTQARIHNIVSTDAGDAVAGVGARTLRVYGLPDWSTPEVSEVITLAGLTLVPTVNSYVIIHRMEVLTKGATSVNVGAITATAVTDGTVTAQINAGNGQTLMAIYGFPSGQTLHIVKYYGSLNRAQSTTADVKLLLNPEPQTELTGFVTKHLNTCASLGSTKIEHLFLPYAEFTGPGILKLRAVASAANSALSGGFDLIMRN